MLFVLMKRYSSSNNVSKTECKAETNILVIMYGLTSGRKHAFIYLDFFYRCTDPNENNFPALKNSHAAK